MEKPMRDEANAYYTIKNFQKMFGVFRKTCFHVHTPESHDYKLMSNWDHNHYETATDEDIYKICVERNVFPDLVKIDYFEPKGCFDQFNSRNEVLSFLLLAEELIAKNIEIC